MPILFIVFGMRFFFYSNEHLPIHIHVRNADGEARFEVEEIKLISNKSLKNRDIKLAEGIIQENRAIIIENWNEHYRR